jgi:polysaccharide biosynthesis transport protein
MSAGEQSFSFSKLWRALQRRLIPAACLAVLVFAAAIVAAVVLPSRYVSSGTILIEQQELPADIVRSTVTSYATQRIQVITQRVMTTDNLLGIIERNNLYPDMRNDAREEMIEAMRKDTRLNMISADVIDPRSGGAVKAVIAFSLSYSNSNPRLAAAVANELVTLYLERNVETRQRNSREAVEFLDGESARVLADIKKVEAALTQIKSISGNELPEMRPLNMSTLDRVVDEIRNTDMSIQMADQQLSYLDAELAKIDPTAQVYTSTGVRVQTPADRRKVLRATIAQAEAAYSPDHPDVVRMRRELAGLEASLGSGAPVDTTGISQQLREAQSQLTNARQRYGAEHPDVQRLERQVESLEKTQQIAASAPGDSGNADENADNPAYVQLKERRQTVVNQRQNIEDMRNQLRAKLEEYEQRLAKSPGVEREYATLLRDLDAAQAQYRQNRQKQMDAQMSVNLETERKGERFTLIDPPLVPGRPISPNRQLIVIMGLLSSLALAAGLVVLLEMLDGSVRGRQAVQTLLSVPPLAVIPYMMTTADHVARRRRLVYTLCSVAVALALVPVLVHFLYRPLDLLWAAGMRRLGA